MALTIEAVRARVETDLDDPTLQKILDGCVQAVDRAAGKVASESETFRARGTREISLVRLSASITTVEERATIYADAVVLVEGTDFRKSGDYRLIRLNGVRWGDEVKVDYVPEVDPALRDSVTMDLCQMVVEFRALDKETVGDWAGEQKDYEKRRKALLATVREGRSPIL